MSLDDARRLLARLDAARLVLEAEQAAHGVRAVTVVHGDVQTAEEEDRLHQLRQWVWQRREQVQLTTRGTGDTTGLMAGPDAGELVEQLVDLAGALNPGWWRIRRSSR